MFTGDTIRFLTTKEAEVYTILFAMKKAKELRYRRIFLASDALEVVKAVNGVDDSSIKYFIKDILVLMLCFETAKFEHIVRNFNVAAII